MPDPVPPMTEARRKSIAIPARPAEKLARLSVDIPVSVRTQLKVRAAMEGRMIQELVNALRTLAAGTSLPQCVQPLGVMPGTLRCARLDKAWQDWCRRQGSALRRRCQAPCDMFTMAMAGGWRPAVDELF